MVIGTHEDRSKVERVLERLVGQMREIGGEVIIVASYSHELPEMPEVRWLSVPGEKDLVRLRSVGIRAAKGAVVAIGEEHAVPRPDWCRAVLRGHAEHPDADAIAGCLVNATPERVAAHASFLTFATPFTPPMPALPLDRPPPLSVLSLKRRALASLGDLPDTLDARLLPQIFSEGRIAADDRIIADHFQDFTFAQAVRNQFWVNRSSYGHSLAGAGGAERRKVARWILRHLAQQFWREARAAVPAGRRRRRELLCVAVFAGAASVGGVCGALFGPGRSSERMA